MPNFLFHLLLEVRAQCLGPTKIHTKFVIWWSLKVLSDLDMASAETGITHPLRSFIRGSVEVPQWVVFQARRNMLLIGSSYPIGTIHRQLRSAKSKSQAHHWS